MKKRNTVLLPKAQRNLSILGENIRLARLRRKFSMEQVAERANISRPTLLSIERGNPNVTIGAYVKVLAVLGLDKDIVEVANDDKLGRRLQDARLIIKERAPKTHLSSKIGMRALNSGKTGHSQPDDGNKE
jgi:transcriptional regulator with XRE-family HTH domain